MFIVNYGRTLGDFIARSTRPHGVQVNHSSHAVQDAAGLSVAWRGLGGGKTFLCKKPVVITSEHERKKRGCSSVPEMREELIMKDENLFDFHHF